MTFSDGFPPFYPERFAPNIMANDSLYLIYSACVMIVAIMVILPGFQSFERLLFGIHWGFSLLIGGSIIACIFGVHWHVAEETTEIPFLREEKVVLNATIGLKIGLTSFNVTLKGFKQGGSAPEISFSEKYFYLTTDAQLETALRRGVPSPILNVVEHFSGNRISSIWPWSRRYWIVGHFSSLLLWSAFAGWLVFNLIVHAVVKYGSLCLCCTGFLMIFANISFASITRFGQPLVTVGYYSENVTLVLSFGWCFWLCLSVGILCICWAAFIFYEDNHNPKAIRVFFNIENQNELGMEFNQVMYSRKNSSVSSTSMIDQSMCKSNLKELQSGAFNDAFVLGEKLKSFAKERGEDCSSSDAEVQIHVTPPCETVQEETVAEPENPNQIVSMSSIKLDL